MAHLTLQEVVDRLNKNYPSKKESGNSGDRAGSQSYRPEFYIPRITRIFASLLFGASAAPGSSRDGLAI